MSVHSVQRLEVGAHSHKWQSLLLSGDTTEGDNTNHHHSRNSHSADDHHARDVLDGVSLGLVLHAGHGILQRVVSNSAAHDGTSVVALPQTADDDGVPCRRMIRSHQC